jgi:hypothetical protein
MPLKLEGGSGNFEVIDLISDCGDEPQPQIPAEQNANNVGMGGLELPRIRMKICKKIYSTLTVDLKIEKGLAKLSTLHLEDRVQSVVEYTSPRYVESFKK